MCEKKKEGMTNELVKFIYQLSTEDAEIAVGILKKLICFIKGDKKKQLTLLVIVIRLNNNSQTDIWVFVNSECTKLYIN